MSALVAMGAPGGWVFVFRRTPYGGAECAVLRRGFPRGVARTGPIDVYQERDAIETRERVRALGTWHTGELFAWARRSGWGLIDGVPFNRALIRRAVREHAWTVGRWGTVAMKEGACLVLWGPRGSRLLIMSGRAIGVDCVGPSLVDGTIQRRKVTP